MVGYLYRTFVNRSRYAVIMPNHDEGYAGERKNTGINFLLNFADTLLVSKYIGLHVVTVM